MPSSFTTPLFASADTNAGSSILSFAFLPVILLAMYFLMIRPQRKRMREQQSMQASIEVGQTIVTTSGIFGTITGEDGENRFWLEIDDENEVQIRVARAAIQNVVSLDDDLDDNSANDSASSLAAQLDLKKHDQDKKDNE